MRPLAQAYWFSRRRQRWLPLRRIWGGSITAAELICYGPASRPQDDVSTSGGAIDATMRPVFTQLTANAIIEVVSDGADTRTVTILGRDTTGALVTTSIVLNGATAVDGAQTYERILSVTLSATSATRTVTVRQGAAGATIATVPPNETGFYALFISSFSTTSPQVRYEKLFWKNTDASLTLTAATLTLTADPSAVTQIGVAASVGDSGSVANRLTAPGGITFVGVGTAQNVPGGGNLAAGAAIGVWIQQSLAANNAPIRSTFTSQLAGNTT